MISTPVANCVNFTAPAFFCSKEARMKSQSTISPNTSLLYFSCPKLEFTAQESASAGWELDQLKRNCRIPLYWTNFALPVWQHGVDILETHCPKWFLILITESNSLMGVKINHWFGPWWLGWNFHCHWFHGSDSALKYCSLTLKQGTLPLWQSYCCLHFLPWALLSIPFRC